jgi:hypothetical protein
VYAQRTTERFRLSVEGIEISVAQGFRKASRRQDASNHMQVRHSAAKLFGRFLDVLQRQNRHGTKPAIKINVPVCHHIVVSTADHHRPFRILNVTDSQRSSRIDYRAIDAFPIQDFRPCLRVVRSNNVWSLVDDAPSHAVKAIRRREKGIKKNLLVPLVRRLEVFEHDLVSLENMTVCIHHLCIHEKSSRYASTGIASRHGVNVNLGYSA